MHRSGGTGEGPQLLTVMFTDIVASTEFTAARGETAARQARAAHDSLVRRCLVRHGGTEVQTTGDGFLLTFGSARRALDCAADIQRALAAEARRAPADTLQVRIGVHVGEVSRRDDGLFGNAVNAASRIMARAGAGQVLTSELVATLAGGEGLELRAAGEAELKGLEGAWRLFELSWDAAAAVLPLPPALDDQGQLPFVGRTEALDELRACWDDAVSGRPRLALIAGEPGIGKTSLAAELSRRVHGEGAQVVFGRCDEEPLLPYQPFVEAMRFYARNAGHVERLPGLGRLVPELEEGQVRPEAIPDLEAERLELFESVEELLARLAGQAPLVFVLDDLHWADRATLLLLRHLMRTRREIPILLLGTYRDTDLDRRHPLAELLADLRRERGFLRVRLTGLSQTEVREAMEAAAGHSFSGRGLAIPEALWRETEGNPFFLGEMVRHFVESGKFFQRDGRWVIEGTVDDLGLPEGIREVIGRRLNRLTPTCNKVLGVAALLGHQFEFRVVRRMTELPDSEVEAALEEALQAQLIIAAAGAALPVYAFTHSLVRQVLHEELSLPRVQRLHVLAAEALEQEHARDLDLVAGQIAGHLQQAGAAADAAALFSYSSRAARLAQKASAYEEAARHWQAALDAWAPGVADPQERAHADERLGDLMYATGYDWEGGIRHLEAALRVYEETGRPDRAARVHAKLGRSLSSYWDRSDIPRAIEHLRTAAAVMEPLGDHPARMHLLTGLATAYLYAYDFEPGEKAAAEGLAMAVRLGDDLLWAEAGMLSSFYLGVAGRVGEATEMSERAYSIAKERGTALSAFLTGWFVITAQWMAGNPRRSLAVSEEMLAQSLPPIQQRTALGLVAMSAWHAGDLARSREVSEQVPDDVVARCYLLHGAGRWEELIEEAGIERMEGTGNHWIPAALRWLRADALATLDRRDEAIAEMERVARRGRRPHLGSEISSRSLLAMLLLERLDLEAARPHLERLRELETSVTGPLGTSGWPPAADGLRLVAEGRVDEGRSSIESGLETFRRYSLPWYQAQTLRSWARLLDRRGDSAAAEAVRDRLADLYRAIGAGRPWLESVGRA